MPTKIAAASVCNQVGLNRSIEYSAHAGRACIDESSIDDSQIGLLLNIGIYRDQNIHEPAVASLIQGRMALNGKPRPSASGERMPSTLSIDLSNGVCGFFNAIQLADSFLTTKATQAALVVASDVHPSGEAHERFPYDHLGAAVLLTASHDNSGFHDIVHKSSDDDYLGSRSFTDVMQPTGARGSLEVEQDEEFCERLNDFMVGSAAEYLASRSIDVRSLKHVIVATPPHDMSTRLTKHLGLSADQIIDVMRYGRGFSSLPILGYCTAEERGLTPGDRLLFVGAGAGLTFACGLYSV